MIFVTVGTTYFDELIREVDRLASEDFFKEEIICQIASGTYKPRFCRYVTFLDTIDRYVSECSLLITHGGMTVLEAIWRGKAVIAVSNKNMANNHQVLFLKKMGEIFGLTWTDNPQRLSLLIQTAKISKAHFHEPHISRYIKGLLEDSKR
jgi:UDP-N-acetylglucosamine transferase subunit ALG13